MAGTACSTCQCEAAVLPQNPMSSVSLYTSAVNGRSNQQGTLEHEDAIAPGTRRLARLCLRVDMLQTLLVAQDLRTAADLALEEEGAAGET